MDTDFNKADGDPAVLMVGIQTNQTQSIDNLLFNGDKCFRFAAAGSRIPNVAFSLFSLSAKLS